MSNLTEKFNTLWSSVMDLSQNQADAVAAAEADKDVATANLATANANLESKTSELATANANLESKTSELATANANLESKTSELATQTSLVASTQASLNALTAENKKNTDDLATANANLESKTSELAAANADLASKTSDLETANLAFASKSSEVATKTSELATANANLSTANKNLATAKMKDDDISKHYHFDSIRIQRHDVNGSSVRGQKNYDKKFLFSYIYVVTEELKDGKWNNRTYRRADKINSYKRKVIPSFLGVPAKTTVDTTPQPKAGAGDLNDFVNIQIKEIDADTLELKYDSPINYNNLIGIDLGNNTKDIKVNTGAAKYFKNGKRVANHPMKWVNGCTIQLLNGTNVIYETRIIDQRGGTNYPIYPSAISTPQYTYNGLTDHAQYRAFLIAGPKYKGSPLESMVNRRNNLANSQKTLQQNTQLLFLMKNKMARVDREHMRSHWLIENSRKNKALEDLKKEKEAHAKTKAAADLLAGEAVDDEAEIAKLKADLDSANADKAKANKELATANANLESKTTDLATKTSDLATKTAELATANASLATANQLLPRITASYANDTGKLTVNYFNVKSSKHFWGIYNNNTNPFEGNNGKYKGWGEITQRPKWGYLNGTHVAPTGDFEATGSYTLHHPNLAIGGYKVILWSNVGTPNNENRNIMHGQDPNVAYFTKSSQPTASVPAGIPAGFREAFTDSKFVTRVYGGSDGKILVVISLHDAFSADATYSSPVPPFKGNQFDKFVQKIKEHGGRTCNNLGDLYEEMYTTGKWAMRFGNKSYQLESDPNFNADNLSNKTKKSDYFIMKCKGTFTSDWALPLSATRKVDITWYTSHQ